MSDLSSADNASRNDATITSLFNALEQGDIARALTFWAEDCHDKAAVHGAAAARLGVRQTLEFVHAAFPTARWQVTDMVCDQESVACQVTVIGAQLGEIYGVPPTGQRVRWRHFHFFRLRDAVIVEHDAVRDDRGLLQQLQAQQLRDGSPAKHPSVS